MIPPLMILARRLAFGAFCFSGMLLAQEPVLTQPVVTAESEKSPTILEISVHEDAKITAMVIWKVGETKVAYDLARPFSIEWVVPPAGATDFLIFPSGTQELKSDKWIPISAPEIQAALKNIYVSVRLESGAVPVIDSDYISKEIDGKPVRRDFSRTPSVHTGWSYIGNWDPNTLSWKTVYWLNAVDAELLMKRKKLVTAPSLLLGTEIVADFPVRLRQEASSDSLEVVIGQVIRPGTRANVTEVRFDVDSNVHGVWAKITF